MLTAPHGNITNGEYLEWESQGEEGHAHCRGFNYSNGNLVVPVNGLYRVFLQITYESKTEYHCSVNELRLTNKVYKIWDGYNVDVPLLISVDTVSCSTTQWSKSLYTEGLFSLNANTRLRVSSSCPELIVKKECQMFFGAELRYLESTSHQ
uniref:lymphotoxin-alpha n=1 Tax=Monopterus albus TaxID=43700 RepID=UPI0009B46553|nr:lymphotoxin-alpha-like [Monopterus albus]